MQPARVWELHPLPPRSLLYSKITLAPGPRGGKPRNEQEGVGSGREGLPGPDKVSKGGTAG